MLFSTIILVSWFEAACHCLINEGEQPLQRPISHSSYVQYNYAEMQISMKFLTVKNLTED